MGRGVLFLGVWVAVMTGLAVHLVRAVLFAARESYFRVTPVTGWMFRDTDRYGQPILFWFLFVFHVLGALAIGSMAALGAWQMVRLLLGTGG